MSYNIISRFSYKLLIIIFLCISYEGASQIGIHYDIDLNTPSQKVNHFKIQEPLIATTKLQIEKYSPDKLPLFCKMEYNIEQKTKFPIRFRLGTVETVDRLEGK